LTKFALEAHALGDLEACDDTPLDLLAGLSGGFAPSPVFAAGFGSVLRAPDLFILPAFSSGEFFPTLSHRFLKLSDLLAQLGVLRITLLGPR
jgi:hypothetical protein